MTRPDLDPDLQRLGDALHASTTLDLGRQEPGVRAARAARTRHPRRRVFAGGTLALAGVGAALVVALSGPAATPAFAITRADDGSVLVKLNYRTNQTLPQVNAKLASMGLHERITIYMVRGAPSVTGPVTCTQGPGANTPIRVLVGTNGAETISAGQSAANTAAGSFHLDRCTVTRDNASGNVGSPGA
jgi:hypothetical protein